jgi:hypothetical protein
LTTALIELASGDTGFTSTVRAEVAVFPHLSVATQSMARARGARSSLRDIFRQIECLTPKQMIDVAADRARITEQSVADVLGDAPHQATVVSEWLAQYAASAKPTVPLVPPDNTDPSERPVNP